jgi:DNA-directed RNA polymerase subunit RPC12/RpoP
MESLEELIEAHEIDLKCPSCSRTINRSIAWLRKHRDMACPSCETTIILGTSKLNAEIRNIERQMAELHRQLTQKFGGGAHRG